MAKQQRVTVAMLARALITMTENGYGDCPVYVDTARDTAPLRTIVFRRRGTALFLCEEASPAFDSNGKIIDLIGQDHG